MKLLKLINQVKAKEFELAIKIESLKNAQKELESTKQKLEKLSEIMTAGRQSPDKEGLGYAEEKGKAIAEGPTVFVKAASVNHGESSKKPIAKKIYSKHKIICHFLWCTRSHQANMFYDALGFEMEVSCASSTAHWSQHCSKEAAKSCLEKEGSDMLGCCSSIFEDQYRPCLVPICFSC